MNQLPLIQIRHGVWPPEESVGIPPSPGQCSRALVSCLDFPTVSVVILRTIVHETMISVEVVLLVSVHVLALESWCRSSGMFGSFHLWNWIDAALSLYGGKVKTKHCGYWIWGAVPFGQTKLYFWDKYASNFPSCFSKGFLRVQTEVCWFWFLFMKPFYSWPKLPHASAQWLENGFATEFMAETWRHENMVTSCLALLSP